MSEARDVDLPWVPLHTTDILTSMKYRRMSTAARGLYTEMLFWMWREGPLPQDPDALARILIPDAAEIRRLLPEVLPCFVNGDGKLTSPRIEKEYRKARDIHLRKSRGGRKGGKKSRPQPTATKQDGRSPSKSPARTPGTQEHRTVDITTTSPSGSNEPSVEGPDTRKRASAPAWEGEYKSIEKVLGEVGLLDSDLNDPAWWVRLNGVVESSGFGDELYLATELRKYAAWVFDERPRRTKHKRGLRNWVKIALKKLEDRDFYNSQREKQRWL